MRNLIAALPLLLLAFEPNTIAVTNAQNTVEPFLITKQQSFPDYSSNYEKTVLEPQRAAQRALEAQVVTYTAPIVKAPTGSCMSWMTAAGITDPGSAYTLIMRESGCNPNAVNASSGSCGIGQQLPCGKWPHTWNDPVGGMIDMQNYVFGTYGLWANALAHSYNFGWY